MDSMTPSDTITAGQVAKFLDLLSAGLRKSGLASEPTQKVLETEGAEIVTEFISNLRNRVDKMSNMIVRRVKVNRDRTPHGMLDATGWKPYTSKDVVSTMPRGAGEEVEVVFFKVGRYVCDFDLDKEYELRGLTPVDPFSLGAVNEADPAFADEHPNGTYWKDVNGKWYYAYFNRWLGERRVDVRQLVNDWLGCWWFAGVRKPATTD